MSLILEVKFRGDLLNAIFYGTLKAQKISIGALRVFHIIFEAWESAVKKFGLILFSLILDDRIECNFRKATLEGVRLHNRLQSEILKNDGVILKSNRLKRFWKSIVLETLFLKVPRKEVLLEIIMEAYHLRDFTIKWLSLQGVWCNFSKFQEMYIFMNITGSIYLFSLGRKLHRFNIWSRIWRWWSRETPWWYQR